MKRNLFLLIGILLTVNVIAQTDLDRRIDFSVENISVGDALLSLCEKADLSISFQSRLFDEGQKITFHHKNQSIKFLLSACLAQTEIGFKWDNNRIILYQKPPPIYTISGFVEDSLSGERLVAANVYDQLSGKGTTTNEYGFYSLSIPRGKAELSFSYLGFNPKTYSTNIKKNLHFTVPLQAAITLTEIVVTDKKYAVRDGISIVDAPNYAADELRKIPAIGGEPDVIRYFQSLPGVEAGSGNLGGLTIRGGETDQNLILLDGVPVYNPSHTFGLFSIFNENIVKSARLYKGRFPSKYSGRLSSVMDIQTKEGNNKEFKFGAGMSLFATSAFAEGPLKKEKTSFFLSARRTHLDPIFRAISFSEEDVESNTFVGYYFYDINVKVNHSLSNRDKLFVSFYRGKDKFFTDVANTQDFTLMEEMEEPAYMLNYQNTFFSINWGNSILSSRWNRVWNNKLFSNTTFTYSQFAFNLFGSNNEYIEEEERSYNDLVQYDFKSKIEDYAVKVDFDYNYNNTHHLKFGGGIKQRIFTPVLRYQELELEEFDENSDEGFYESIDSLLGEVKYFATEINLYVEDNIKFSDKLTAQIGFHNAIFTAANAGWNAFQPRLSLQYKFNQNGTIYTAYSQMSQFLHVLSPAGISMPFDLWVPSTRKVRPQKSSQILIGTQWQLPANFTFGTEAYYKKLNNLVTYKREISEFFIGGENNSFDWEEEVTSGNGWNYGIEASLKRTKGKTTGYLNYTWSEAERKYKGLSQDQRFTFRFNRKHVFKLGLNQEFGPKFSIFSAWYYGAGQYTTPSSINITGDVNQGDTFQLVLSNNSDQLNNYRLPAYHKLDISFNFHWPKRRVDHYFSFSINNFYNRRNAIFTASYQDASNPEVVDQQDIKGLPVFPGLRYAIKF